MITESFLATANVVGSLLRAPELAARWHEPSALPEFRISGLAGHLARAAFNVETYLDTPAPAQAVPVDAAGYFLAVLDPEESLDDPVPTQIRARGEETAGSGPDDLADRFDAVCAQLAPRLRKAGGDQSIEVVGGLVLRLDDYLVTRLVEFAVHLDDLAVSLDLPTPALPDQAADLVVTTLARIARVRHGTVPVLRALSRRERASGPVAAF